MAGQQFWVWVCAIRMIFSHKIRGDFGRDRLDTDRFSHLVRAWCLPSQSLVCQERCGCWSCEPLQCHLVFDLGLFSIVYSLLILPFCEGIDLIGVLIHHLRSLRLLLLPHFCWIIQILLCYGHPVRAPVTYVTSWASCRNLSGLVDYIPQKVWCFAELDRFNLAAPSAKILPLVQTRIILRSAVLCQQLLPWLIDISASSLKLFSFFICYSSWGECLKGA